VYNKRIVEYWMNINKFHFVLVLRLCYYKQQNYFNLLLLFYRMLMLMSIVNLYSA